MTVGSPPLAPPGAVRGARITGLGVAHASRTVTADALTERFGKDAEWLRVRTGITGLRRLGPGESLLDLAATAGAQAVSDAGLCPDDVDMLLVATCSAGGKDGALSHQLAGRLGLRAMALDVNAACAGFCYALSTASALIGTGAARAVLIVGAEQMSTLVDPADLGTSILFGDGAGAAVVTASADGEAGIAPPAWSSDGALAGVLEIPAGQTVMRMRGREVFRWAVDEVHKVAAAAMAKAGVTPDEIDVFVPHQANLRIVEAISRKLGLARATTVTDIVDCGNTSAASIPMALRRLRDTDGLPAGRLALLAGFGAGLTIAAQVVRLP